MTTRKKIVLAIVALALALGIVAGAIAVSRGDDQATIPAPEPPIGKPILPDLMPSPQLNVTTGRIEGKWHIYFKTIITNVGAGDFILRGTRAKGGLWQIEQDIPYSRGGAKRVPTRATAVWGGDGHDHWHILRVADVWLVPLGKNGRPLNDSRDRIDSKIGFCYYDHTHQLERGPEKAVYSAHSCGHEGDTVMGMGLSPGWNDTYTQTLPGQNIDVSGLPDGNYRLWTVIDKNRWFREASTRNNRTWIDLNLKMTPRGLSANTIGTGPRPS